MRNPAYPESLGSNVHNTTPKTEAETLNLNTMDRKEKKKLTSAHCASCRSPFDAYKPEDSTPEDINELCIRHKCSKNIKSCEICESQPNFLGNVATLHVQLLEKKILTRFY